MHSRHTRHSAGIAMALAIVVLGGWAMQVRAERPSANQASPVLSSVVLFGNAGQGVAGVQDSSHKGGGPGDSTHHGNLDSLKKAIQDSINRANHIRDSINRAHEDSLKHANHGRDSANKAHADSLKNLSHLRDSINKAHADSLHKEAHKRDSINHGHLDSIKVRNHERDSLIHARVDSLIKAKRDSLHRRDTTHHGLKRDSSHHGFRSVNDGGPEDAPLLGNTIPDASISAQENSEAVLSKSAGAAATPIEITLAQNYPNPFGGAAATTAIEFSLPSSQAVTMSVYNAAGQFVQTVVSGVLSAGTHNVTFDASNLPAGIYFYKLATESSTMTKRMIKVH